MKHPESKLERREAYKKKYNQLKRETPHANFINQYIPRVWLADKENRWFEGDRRYEEKPFIREYGRSNRKRFGKRLSNRKIRRYREEIPNGGAAHKLYDYWWEID